MVPKLSVISLATAKRSSDTLSLVQRPVVLLRIWALRFGMIRIRGRSGLVREARRSKVTPAAILMIGWWKLRSASTLSNIWGLIPRMTRSALSNNSWWEAAASTSSSSASWRERAKEDPEIMIRCELVFRPLIMAVAIFPTPIKPIIMGYSLS